MVQKGLILWDFTVHCFYRKLFLKWFVSLQCVGSFVTLLHVFRHLVTSSKDTVGQLDVLWHDGETFWVETGQIDFTGRALTPSSGQRIDLEYSCSLISAFSTVQLISSYPTTLCIALGNHG